MQLRVKQNKSLFLFIWAVIFIVCTVFLAAPNQVNAARKKAVVHQASVKAHKARPKAKAVAPAPQRVNLFIQNKKSVSAKGGEVIELVLGWQNMGQRAWKRFSLLPRQVTSVASGSQISFADGSWVSKSLILDKVTAVEPDDTVRETIQFRAPGKQGSYVAKFDFQVDGEIASEAGVEIPVTVIEDAPADYHEPWSEGNASPITVSPRLPAEPRIRVGIWKPTDYIQFRSEDDDYDVYDGANKVGTLPAHQLGVLKFINNNYSFKGGELEFSTTNYIRLAPANDPHAVFTLLNLKRQLRWKGQPNFNSYRGALEYRLAQDGITMYVINDLFLDDYVAGIAETSNGAPIEYIKALLTAARTYAYYVEQSTSKHGKRNFDVVAHTGDQLYLGYESEKISNRVVEAARATRGYMITYEKNLVVTPYFGHSNGRTKSWTEVWGGNPKPWLVSVEANYDKGHRLYGHGVGMSQRDAALRAEKEGVSWQELLKYYYTGVVIEHFYD